MGNKKKKLKEYVEFGILEKVEKEKEKKKEMI